MHVNLSNYQRAWCKNGQIHSEKFGGLKTGLQSFTKKIRLPREKLHAGSRLQLSYYIHLPSRKIFLNNFLNVGYTILAPSFDSVLSWSFTSHTSCYLVSICIPVQLYLDVSLTDHFVCVHESLYTPTNFSNLVLLSTISISIQKYISSPKDTLPSN